LSENFSVCFFCEDGDERLCRQFPSLPALSVIKDHGYAIQVAARTKQGRMAGFGGLSRFCEFGRQSACSLYRPMALFTVADLGYSVAAVGFATTFAAETQA